MDNKIKKGDLVGFLDDNRKGKVVDIRTNDCFVVEDSDGFEFPVRGVDIFLINKETEAKLKGHNNKISNESKFREQEEDNSTFFIKTNLLTKGDRVDYGKSITFDKSKNRDLDIKSTDNQSNNTVKIDIENVDVEQIYLQSLKAKYEDKAVSVASTKKVNSNSDKIEEVDLHYESIDSLSLIPLEGSLPVDKLKIQLEYFERRLNNAIIDGFKGVEFIHGGGRGILKENLLRILSSKYTKFKCEIRRISIIVLFK